MANTHAAVTGLPNEDLGILAGTPKTMGIPVPVRAWHGPVCHALRRILSSPPAEAHLFRRVLSHAARFGNDLAADATDRPVGKDRRPEEFPLASFLLSMPARPSLLERTLAWIILEAHLSRGHGDLVVALAQISRGLTGKGSSKLKDTIAKCSGPSRLLAKMERLGGLKPELGLTGHQTFDSLWRDELKAFCVSLIRQAEPDAVDTEDVAGNPVDQAGALTESPTEQEGEDPDDGTHFPSVPVCLEQTIRGPTMRHALDWSVHMSRQSSPDLLRPLENVFPTDLRERDWQVAVAKTETALERGDALDAEYQLAAVLSIEAGLNAREASNLSLGSRTDGRIPVVDLAAHALRRPELLPPNYFIPKENDQRWLPTGGDAIFPLSLRCVSLAKRLLETRDAQPDALSNHLLLTGPIDKGKLRTATKSQHRLALAIGIADLIGPDAAQRAFGETFGLSAAPIFYGAYPALDLACAIASVNGFASHEIYDAPWRSVSEHWLGSRVRPKEPPYAKVWVQLQGSGRRSKGRPSNKDLLDDWRQRRDRLVIHFFLATGHRPSKSLAEMTLHDFLPRQALALVGDKAMDPAHVTRLVCTGWRFTGELEGFVNELSRIARNSGIPEAKDLASRILLGAAPVFSIPTEEGPEPIDICALLGRLDPLWSYRPNLNRHGLCQFLIQRGVDPELRYFQMGWLSHDHHATSESAPFPPAQLGRELAGIVDDWLDQCGWLGGGVAHAPDVLIPRTSLQDWEAKRKEHAQAVNAALSALRAELHEMGDALESKVWERIRADVEQVLSSFDASESSSRALFHPRPSAGGQLAINQLQVEALLAPFSGASSSPAERYVAVKLLHRALAKTAKDHGVRVYLPEVPVLSRHRLPSPFLPGVGLAIAQVDALKDALTAHLADITKPKDAVDMAAIAVWSIVLHTPHCDLDRAVAVLTGAGKSEHSNAEPWLLRVPLGEGHVVLTGDQAALTRRLVECPGWELALDAHSKNGFSSLGSFVRRLLPGLCAPKESTVEVGRKVVETARVANVINLNGAERLILNKVVEPVAASAERAATVADGVTTVGGVGARKAGNQSYNESPHVGKNPPHAPLRDVSNILRAFDPDFTGEILGKPAEPVAKRHPQLKLALSDALSKVGAKPTASRLVLEYAWHLLVKGGPRSSGGQAISTINKTIHRLGPALRSLEMDESLEGLSSTELTAMCHVACQTSRRRSSREVLGELRRFFKHFSSLYRIALPEWDCLYRAFGMSVPGGDPALLGDTETSRVVEQLYSNALMLDAPNADPAEKRYREICLVAALIAESSGARPRSIHGLTFADVVLGAERDYIHLKARGRFASIKTRTAAGFIPLEGKIWNTHAAWFASWFNNACAALPPDALDAIPLFQIPGEAIGVRYEMRRVFPPIGSLILWSTQQRRGRTYWLRKRKVRSRHLDVQSKVGSRARDIARAMRLDGHALILTPLVRYISEPTAYSTFDVSTHAIASRSGAVAVTGLATRQVDRASYANDVQPLGRIAKLLRLGCSSATNVCLPEPPQLPRYRSDMTWASLERILRDLVEGNDVDWIASRHSAQKHQVHSIAHAQHALAARLKTEFGTSRNQLGPPRRAGHSIGWFRLLEEEDDRLIAIATDWVAVAAGGQLDEGCCLYERQAVDSLTELATELGLATVCSDPSAGYGTSLVRFSDKAGTPYGAWRGLRWVLAVVWVSQHRLGQKHKM